MDYEQHVGKYNSSRSNKGAYLLQEQRYIMKLKGSPDYVHVYIHVCLCARKTNQLTK